MLEEQISGFNRSGDGFPRMFLLAKFGEYSAGNLLSSHGMVMRSYVIASIFLQWACMSSLILQAEGAVDNPYRGETCVYTFESGKRDW